MCCAGVLLMGVAPRIPGGGGKFKKTFENLADAEKVLLWTNNNHTSEWGSGTADTGTQLYAAYCIAVKAYTSVSPQYVMKNIVVRDARCCVTANNRSINRMVTFDGANITIGTPFSGDTSHWESTIPYQIFGIKGTEIK